jgi:hypothetical protein
VTGFVPIASAALHTAPTLFPGRGSSQPKWYERNTPWQPAAPDIRYMRSGCHTIELSCIDDHRPKTAYPADRRYPCLPTLKAPASAAAIPATDLLSKEHALCSLIVNSYALMTIILYVTPPKNPHTRNP